jgi:dephospho-CoA kinase
MKLFGLTGGIACGKSTVAESFRKAGVTVVDCDAIVHDLQQPGTSCVQRIAAVWPNVVSPSGVLNREALGQLVFSDPQARRRLGRIMNRAVFARILRDLLSLWWRLPRDSLVVIDAPLLFENKVLLWLVGGIVVVSADRTTQIDRLASRNSLSATAASQRIDAQMPVAEKERRADFVIRNGGVTTLADVNEAARRAVDWMNSRPSEGLVRGWGRVVSVAVGAIASFVVLAFATVRWMLV